MNRPILQPITLLLALTGLGGCSLLEPFPGGDDVQEFVGQINNGPLIGGTPQNKLINPIIKQDITVVSQAEPPAIAIPGEAVDIHLAFQSFGADSVMGGGIRIKGQKDVQWTLISGIENLKSGEIKFKYAIDANACDPDRIAPLCHNVVTEQFAVVRQADGQFFVSSPTEVEMVLMCANCKSPSCVEIFDAGQCRDCKQPQTCFDVHNQCFSDSALAMNPGQVTENEARLFNTLFGDNGAMWASTETCTVGSQVCERIASTQTCSVP